MKVSAGLVVFLKAAMESDLALKDEQSKKRACKIYRACWECKKRKIQRDSAYDTESNPSGLGSLNTKGDDEIQCPLHIGERLSKLELLFEKFVCRRPSNAGPGKTPLRHPLSDTHAHDKPPKLGFGLPEIPSNGNAITVIGDGILATQHTNWNSAPSIKTLINSEDSGYGSTSETARRSLIALLPSQNDADVIFESTNGWMTLRGMYNPAKHLFVNQDLQSYALDMSAVSQEHTLVIARTLLHLAICICNLPPEFNVSRLSNIWSLDATMQNYVSTVTSLVTSSDEQMSTLPGLETLLLLAAYHINTGKFRQAWLIVRRGLNLAHLMGFHRIITQPSSSPFDAIENSKFIWRLLVDADRYIGLHLRLPFASEDYPCPEDAPPHLTHRCKLMAICRQIAELDNNVTPQTYVQALALDERLESLMKELPKEFWEVPNIPSTARSPESAEVLDRIAVQIWHFELKIFVNLPFLLRAPKESRYEYSKLTALQASRALIMRWFALHNAGITQAGCRLAEMGLLIATITIGLDILIEMGTKEKSEVQKRKGNDFAIICRVIAELEKLGNSSPREKIASRSAVVIRKLLSSLDPSRRTAEKARLVVPYFGIIEVAYHKPPIRPAFDLDSDTGNKLNTTATGSHIPVFSFVSNELWPPSEAYGGDLDFDIVLFDGLEDMDTEGNWVF
ncbi:hypothetical protein CC78DRAFT_582263 [Lojkania enalia]|uniref:Transcription factor domain-containing protein n=1 Tax=Lojkania enalia TaxID=147567 RepID=A0A9P4N7Q6_9PLEO|nr:hypothetical protein CC78DRAFT_582263 [Didymosphaeria enalia]